MKLQIIRSFTYEKATLHTNDYVAVPSSVAKQWIKEGKAKQFKPLSVETR